MIRLVLSDIDGTLIERLPIIKEEDAKAILTLQKEDISFGLVTGRDIGFCYHLMERHGLFASCVIANNGGSLWIEKEKVMECHMLPQETIRIMEALIPYLDRCHPFICNEKQEYFLMRDSYASEEVWREARNTLSYLGTLREEDLLDYVKKSQQPAVKISVYTYDQKTRDELLPIMKELYPNYVVLPTAVDYIELTQQGVDKGKTLLDLLSRLNLGLEEVAVIGDGWNDVSMFSLIKHSFVMDSAPKEVQEQGRYLVKNVAQAIHSVIQYNKTGMMQARKSLGGKDDGE